LTQVAPTYCVSGLSESGVDDLVISDRIDGHRLLRQAKEELATAFGSPTVEPECELIQIVVQMLMTDCTLVGSHQPSFQQGDHPINPRH